MRNTTPMLCTQCGYNTHMADTCRCTKHKDGGPLGCKRCGRRGHTSKTCHTATNSDGQKMAKQRSKRHAPYKHSRTKSKSSGYTRKKKSI